MKLAPAPTRLSVYLRPMTLPEATSANERNTATAMSILFASVNQRLATCLVLSSE